MKVGVGDLVRLTDEHTIALIVEVAGPNRPRGDALCGIKTYRLAHSTDMSRWVHPERIKEVVSARR